MVVRTPGPIIRSGFPRAGSLAGDQKRDEFIAALQALGGLVLLVLPKLTDTTTSTDASRNAATATWDATVAARLSGGQGSGVVLDFDGTDDEGDIPDADRYSFGNGVVDNPFSVGGLWRPDDANAHEMLIAKQNSAAAEEWELRVYNDGTLLFALTDESASATISHSGTLTGTALALLGGSYDGSGSKEGITAWKNAADITSRGSSGTYVAMENTAALVHIGARYTTKEQFFDGGMGFCFIYERTLNVGDWWTIKTLTNAYFNLAL